MITLPAGQAAAHDTHPAGAGVIFQLQNGLILALYPRAELAKDANIAPGPPQAGEFSIGHPFAWRPRAC